MKKDHGQAHADGNDTHSMTDRGVTRPAHQGLDTHSKTSASKKMEMTSAQRVDMLQQHHTKTLWIYWLIVILGFWMIFSPLTFDYGKNVVAPSGGRSVWLPLADRVLVMSWSDIISGLLLVVLGWRSLTPNRPYSLWACCFIGVWLCLAPLLFWSPSPLAYLNDTLVGTLVIALTILIPGMPNMIMYMKMGSDIPQGWSYNPSSWPQRWIMIVTGFMGWVVSRYLAAFQLGYIDTIWDPFFGNSSERVLNSTMSQSLPISDAGLGALAYTFEFLMGFMGSPARWRTMPWMVAFFGILVIPLGLVHIFLVISQPIAVGAWCSGCLLAAAIMLPMIPLEVDEVIAMAQHMRHATKKGEKFWTVFWKGGNVSTMNKDERSPALATLPQNVRGIFKASIWGMSFPWTLTASSALGIWLMCSPGTFGLSIDAIAANVNHLLGALILVVAVISMGEVVRTGRYLNVAFGLAAAAIPWITKDSTIELNISSTLTGVLVTILSFPRGSKTESYGFWDKYIR